MKEYKTIQLPYKHHLQTDCLNEQAKEGWEVKASYGTQGRGIILERSKLVEKLKETKE